GELLGDQAAPLQAWLDAESATLGKLLSALAILGTPNHEAREAIQGLGEVWSSRLLAALLATDGSPCGWLDAREVLTVRHGELGAIVDWDDSAARFRAWRDREPAPRVVATGFVARTPEGRVTVLGRNGSDYSAAILAALAGARELTLWGDTDGVLSADPRLVPEAVSLAAISYDE